MTDFELRGYLQLPRAFEPAEAQRMADFVWERLADLRGIRRDDPESWKVEQRTHAHRELATPVRGGSK